MAIWFRLMMFGLLAALLLLVLLLPPLFPLTLLLLYVMPIAVSVCSCFRCRLHVHILLVAHPLPLGRHHRPGQPRLHRIVVVIVAFRV